MIYVTRKIHFCAAHRLYDEALSAEANRELFGECVSLHGHNYVLEVTFAGNPDPRAGMVIHLSRLDELVKDRVVNLLDHKYLNEDVTYFRAVAPTAEMIARFAWERLDGAVPDARLHRIRVYTDEWMFADYYGERS